MARGVTGSVAQHEISTDWGGKADTVTIKNYSFFRGISVSDEELQTLDCDHS